MAKFEIGEIAIFDTLGHDYKGVAGHGTECEIRSFEFWESMNGWRCYFPGDPCPYSEDKLWWLDEKHLRKRPSDTPFTEWFEKNINVNPKTESVEARRLRDLEQTVRRTLQNLGEFTSG